MSRSTRILFVGAVVSTPLLVALWALQAFTRDGFRPAFHPMSLLSLGDGGWVQILAFVVVGLLVAGGGVAIGRTLSRATGVFVVLMGAGLVIAGVFVTDAGAGFPAGAPEGAPVMSWHGALHQVGFVLTQIAFLVTGILLIVRFLRERRWGWAAASIAAIVAAPAIAALGDPGNLALRLVVASAIELGLVSAVALALLLERLPVRLAYAEPHGSLRRA